MTSYKVLVYVVYEMVYSKMWFTITEKLVFALDKLAPNTVWHLYIFNLFW